MRELGGAGLFGDGFDSVTGLRGCLLVQPFLLLQHPHLVGGKGSGVCAQDSQHCAVRSRTLDLEHKCACFVAVMGRAPTSIHDATVEGSTEQKCWGLAPATHGKCCWGLVLRSSLKQRFDDSSDGPLRRCFGSAETSFNKQADEHARSWMSGDGSWPQCGMTLCRPDAKRRVHQLALPRASCWQTTNSGNPSNNSYMSPCPMPGGFGGLWGDSFRRLVTFVSLRHEVGVIVSSRHWQDQPGLRGRASCMPAPVVNRPWFGLRSVWVVTTLFGGLMGHVSCSRSGTARLRVPTSRSRCRLAGADPSGGEPARGSAGGRSFRRVLLASTSALAATCAGENRRRILEAPRRLWVGALGVPGRIETTWRQRLGLPCGISLGLTAAHSADRGRVLCCLHFVCRLVQEGALGDGGSACCQVREDWVAAAAQHGPWERLAWRTMGSPQVDASQEGSTKREAPVPQGGCAGDGAGGSQNEA